MNWYETTVSLYIAIYCLCQTGDKMHNLKLAQQEFLRYHPWKLPPPSPLRILFHLR